MIDSPRPPLGAVLAGGRGRRIGGAKATVELLGRPLISYPVEALRAALGAVAVVAKGDSRLPELAGVELWEEPPEPHHPLVGILAALRRAGGRAVLVCACDLPLLDLATVRALAGEPAAGALAVVASASGAMQPLLARYEAGALASLERAPRDVPLRELVAGLAPRTLEVGEEAIFNVNTRADLARAEGRLRERARAAPAGGAASGAERRRRAGRQAGPSGAGGRGGER